MEDSDSFDDNEEENKWENYQSIINQYLSQAKLSELLARKRNQILTHSNPPLNPVSQAKCQAVPVHGSDEGTSVCETPSSRPRAETKRVGF